MDGQKRIWPLATDNADTLLLLHRNQTPGDREDTTILSGMTDEKKIMSKECLGWLGD